MKTPPNLIVLSPSDNVGIALKEIPAGTQAFDRNGYSLLPTEAIALGHKVALSHIAAGERVIRFTMPIAIATKDINKGALVHVHNVKSQYLNNDHDHYE